MNQTRASRSDQGRGDKDYAAESAHLLKLIRKFAPNAKTLLDVACGTGDHAKHLSKELRCEGIDIDPAAIEKARSDVPDALFEVADMETLALGRQFDVVTCLFSSIAYVDSVEILGKTVSRIAAHVRPGGLLIVEPWIMPERWLDESSSLGTDELMKARALIANTVPMQRGLVATKILFGVRVSVERSSDAPGLGWFMFNEYVEAFKKAHIELQFEPSGLSGRGLFSGINKG